MKNPTVHNMPEFKEARKAFQGINSTDKHSLEKSKRRVAEKMFKKMGNSEKEKQVNAGTGRKLTPEEQKFKTRSWPKSGKEVGMKAQMERHEENREFQRKTGRAWND